MPRTPTPAEVAQTRKPWTVTTIADRVDHETLGALARIGEPTTEPTVEDDEWADIMLGA